MIRGIIAPALTSSFICMYLLTYVLLDDVGTLLSYLANDADNRHSPPSPPTQGGTC
jgi:hypothetical protein